MTVIRRLGLAIFIVALVAAVYGSKPQQSAHADTCLQIGVNGCEKGPALSVQLPNLEQGDGTIRMIVKNTISSPIYFSLEVKVFSPMAGQIQFDQSVLATSGTCYSGNCLFGAKNVVALAQGQSVPVNLVLANPKGAEQQLDINVWITTGTNGVPVTSHVAMTSGLDPVTGKPYVASSTASPTTPTVTNGITSTANTGPNHRFVFDLVGQSVDFVSDGADWQLAS